MGFKIAHGDITKMDTDAIVNAANSQLMRGGGVCGAIFRAANSPKLQEDCYKLAPCPTGQAVITLGYDLPAKYIVHTVGPIWSGGGNNEEQLLYNAYANAMQVAWDHDCRSISFPLISSGIYGYPKDEAKEVAERAINDFVKEHDMEVQLVLF